MCNVNSQTSLIDRSVLNQLQYLQSKSLELSYVQSVGDCFKLINTVGRELYNYDKISVLQYLQGGISRLCFQAVKKGEKPCDEEVGLVEDLTCEKAIRDIVSSSITGNTLLSDMSGNISPRQHDGQNILNYVRQDTIEERDDSNEIFIDMVLISLDLKNSHSLLEVSTLYQLTTEQGLASGTYSGQLQPTLQPKYFLRLEKKLTNTNDQEVFHQKHSSFAVLKSFIQLMLISINKMKIIQQQRELQNQKLLEIMQNQTEIQDTNNELSKIQQQNEGLKRMISLQKIVDEFLDELKTQNVENGSNETGLLFFEEFHLKLLSFLHVLIPNCKRMQLFLSKDVQGSELYTYVNAPNQASTESNIRNTADDDESVQMTCQFGAPSHKKPMLEKSRNSIVYNQIDFKPSQCNYLTNYQQVVVPSQMDDISSISPNDQTLIVHNVDKNSGGTSSQNRTMRHQGQNQHRGPSAEPLSRQTSGFNLQASSSSTNLQNQINKHQNPHHQTFHQRSSNRPQHSKFLLRRDYSAQTELNLDPAYHSQNDHHVLQVQTNSSENRRDLSSERVTVQGDVSRIKPNDRLLTSYDEVFHSQLNDESEMLVNIQTQDPSKVRRVDFKLNEQISIIATAIQSISDQSQEGILKKNAKNDRSFCPMIDNLIYSFQEEGKKKHRVLENSIFMPMINSKGQVAGLIQIGNSEKQLTFTESDLDTVRLIAFKLAVFITEAREAHLKKAMFQKQMELSLLHTNLESQSVTKILTLANQLFQKEHSQPLFAVGYFVKKTEKYLRETFNCQYSQILLVDHDKDSIFSFDVRERQARLLRRGELQADSSIANAMIGGNFQDPILWPSMSEQSYILIGDEGSNLTDQRQKAPQSHLAFYSQFINLSIDCPLSYLSSDMPPTYLAMTVRDQSSKVLAVIQLLVRANNIRFTDQDVTHLAVLCQHLSQVFTYIYREGLLSLLSEDQTQKLNGLVRFMSRTHKAHMKHFFRELLQYKFGKINLLKNKIMRKYMDRHMRVDQKLVRKVEKIAEIRDKCSMQRKQEVLDTLKRKVKTINERRQKNALRCLQVVNKYEKLLGIRVKDTVFRFWDRLRREGVSVSNQSNINLQSIDSCTNGVFSPTFNGGASILIHDSSCSMSSISNVNNNSSILDESSITSVLYIRAKSVYKMKKVFNQYKLKRYFDSFVIKAFKHNFRNFLFNIEGRRLIKLHDILSVALHRLNERVFRAFCLNNNKKYQQVKTLKKIASKRGLREMSFGMKQWQNYTEKSMKVEMRNDKSQLSQLAEQCRDTNILQTMMTGLNQIFSQFHFSSVEECLSSNSIKLFFSNIAEQLSESLSSQPFHIAMTFKLPENYCNSEETNQLYCLFVYPDGADRLTIHSSITEQNRHAKNIDVIQMNQFSSISEIEGTGYDFNVNSSHAFLTVVDGSKDCILNQLGQILTPLSYQKPSQEDESQDLYQQMIPSLRVRLAAEHKQAFFIPMIDQYSSSINSVQGSSPLFGTIEVYTRVQSQAGLIKRQDGFNRSKDSHSFSVEDQNRLKQQASILQIGLNAFVQRLNMIHQISQMGQTTIQVNRSLPMSGLVNQLNSQIQRTFKADHCVIVFAPDGEERGFFYNFESGQLFQIVLADTIFQGMIQSRNQRSYTYPMTLGSEATLTKSTLSPRREVFESVTGQDFQALKYMVIECSEVCVLIEVGWRRREDAEMAHLNEFALQRSEGKVISMVQSEIARMTREIKQFTRVTNRKATQNIRDKWLRLSFDRWKKLSYISEMKYDGTPIRNRGYLVEETQTSQDKRRYSSLGPKDSFYSPSFQNSHLCPHNQRVNPHHVPSRTTMQNNRQQSLTRGSQKRSISDNNCQRSSFASQLSNYTPTNTQMINEELILSDVEVEKAAKRKLVSAALVMIAVQAKQSKRMYLQQAMNEWKSFQLSSQITEGAFNKLLELNHKHSKARFDTAMKILTKIQKKNLYQQFMNNIKNARQRKVKSPKEINRMFTDLISTGSVRQSKRHHNELSPQSRESNVRTPFLAGNDTRNFEEEVFALNDNQEGRHHYGSHGQSNQKILIPTNSGDEVESEFSLGTGTATKMFAMVNKARNNSLSGSGFTEMPQPIQQHNLYQNMFKRF